MMGGVLCPHMNFWAYILVKQLKNNEGVGEMKKRIIIGLLVAALVLTAALVASAATGTKQIDATYRDIMIIANGSVVKAEPGMGEPFIVTSEGRTYVPIRMAAEALGFNVEWVDWLNAVQITGSTSSSELEYLKAQNDALRDKIARLEEGGSDLSDLEEDLIDDYDYLEDVEIDEITLDGDEEDVDVTIEVDLGEYEDEWADLDDSDIKDWLADMVSDIQDELSDDTYVSGEITDIDSDDTLVKFTKDGDSSLRITFYDDDYRDGGSDEDDAIDELEDSSYDVGDIEFIVTSVSYVEDDESVVVKLTADDDAEDEWDELYDDGDLEDYIIDICEDIVEVFDDEAGIDLETVDIRFYDDNGSLGSYEYDADEGELV